MAPTPKKTPGTPPSTTRPLPSRPLPKPPLSPRPKAAPGGSSGVSSAASPTAPRTGNPTRPAAGRPQPRTAAADISARGPGTPEGPSGPGAAPHKSASVGVKPGGSLSSPKPDANVARSSKVKGGNADASRGHEGPVSPQGPSSPGASPGTSQKLPPPTPRMTGGMLNANLKAPTSRTPQVAPDDAPTQGGGGKKKKPVPPMPPRTGPFAVPEGHHLASAQRKLDEKLYREKLFNDKSDRRNAEREKEQAEHARQQEQREREAQEQEQQKAEEFRKAEQEHRRAKAEKERLAREKNNRKFNKIQERNLRALEERHKRDPY